jgi:hypothetical protein
MPARAGVKPEAIARCFRRADAPARCGGAALFPSSPACGGGKGRGRPQQEKRQPRIAGGEVQPLAQFQIELVDDAKDGGGRRRAHRFFHRPQGFLAVRGLDQDQAGWVETERADAMTVQPPMRSSSVGGRDEDDLLSRGTCAGENRRDEAEG